MESKKLTKKERFEKRYRQYYEMRARAVKKQIEKRRDGIKKKRKKRSPNSVSSLIKKLTKVFNRYVRLRDCLATTGTRKFGVCISCGGIFPFEKLDAGHWINSTHSIYRFSEENVFIQCRHCNRFSHGNLIPYTLKLIERFGKDKIEEMEKNKYQIKKYTPDELRELIKLYQDKLNLI